MSKTIESGIVLWARSVCDADCVSCCAVLSRTEKAATVFIEGVARCCEIEVDERGEYIFALGRYSMAPIFRP